MITFENVTKFYDGNIGLENASIHIEKGDFVFLVGPSGAGKSTFIKLILKEINADSGRIFVGDSEVTGMSNRRVPALRRNIGIVFQDFRLLPRKTVFENVAFAMEIMHCTKRQIQKRVPPVLSLVGISGKADKYPDELSAGEQQRVAIARAIINNPKVLIADEPTGNLDPDTAFDIMSLLEEINDLGTTIVMVTHAKDIVDRMKKRVVAIEAGHIVRDDIGVYGYDDTTEQDEVSAFDDDFELTEEAMDKQFDDSHLFGEGDDEFAETVDINPDDAKGDTDSSADDVADDEYQPENHGFAAFEFEAFVETENTIGDSEAELTEVINNSVEDSVEEAEAEKEIAAIEDIDNEALEEFEVENQSEPEFDEEEKFEEPELLFDLSKELGGTDDK